MEGSGIKQEDSLAEKSLEMAVNQPQLPHEEVFWEVVSKVFEEHIRQESVFDGRQNTFQAWLCIILEELGEATQAMNSYNNGQDPNGIFAFQKELIETAACCFACLEALLTNE